MSFSIFTSKDKDLLKEPKSGTNGSGNGNGVSNNHLENNLSSSFGPKPKTKV